MAGAFDHDRYNRLLGILSEATLLRLKASHVFVAGVGGSGGQTAIDLARLGIGKLTLADFDVYERHNMNRQIGCFESTLGCRKIEVIGKMCRDINPALELCFLPEGVREENIGRDLEGSRPNFVVETIDLHGLAAKIALHRECRLRRIPALTAPMLGFGTALFVFTGNSPAFEDVLIENGLFRGDRLAPHIGSYIDKNHVALCLKGEAHSPTCGIGATLASGIMATEIIRAIVLGPEVFMTAPDYLYIDLFDRKFIQGRLDLRPAKAPKPLQHADASL